jgi:hypothetical protein
MILLTRNFIHILTLQTGVFKLEGCMDQKLRKDGCAGKKVLVTIQEQLHHTQSGHQHAITSRIELHAKQIPEGGRVHNSGSLGSQDKADLCLRHGIKLHVGNTNSTQMPANGPQPVQYNSRKVHQHPF